MNTRVGSTASARSSANSFCDSGTGAPRSRTSRDERVELERADAQPPRARAAPRPAQQRRHPQPQLGVGERLGHEVVGPALEAAHPVDAPPPAPSSTIKAAARSSRSAPSAARTRRDELEARAVRQPDVEDGEVDPVVLQRAHGVAHAPRR